MNSVLATAKNYYDRSIVRIDLDAVTQANIPAMVPTSQMVPVKYGIENDPLFWISSLIVMNTLNFQFWDIENGEIKRYRRDGMSGAIVMGNCFWDAWHKAIPEDYRANSEKNLIGALGGTLGNFRSEIENEGIGTIFGDIPNPLSRKTILLEVMTLVPLLTCADRIYQQFLSSKVDGEFLARMLASTFPWSYNDIFLKKAQLTLMLALAEYRYRNPEATVDLSVTIAADYQIPKVLRVAGILVYSDELALKVDNGKLIDAGSKEELAIRAASILAGEEISKKFGISIPELDWWIWSNRNLNPAAKFHLTKTTNY